MPGIVTASTVLFVPGDRPERFGKAVAAGAGAVILDLEDAVAAADKAVARDAVAAALADGANDFVVRLSPAGTPDGEADRALLAAIPRPGLAAVVLAKAESPEDVAAVRAALGVPVVALVETALGLVRVAELAAAGADRLGLGALDLGLDLAADADSATIAHARAELVIRSRAAGLPAPLDSPSVAIDDVERVVAEARLARGMGFGGKLCIHPRQIAAVRSAFAPTAEEVAAARRIIDGIGDAGVASVDGGMVDAPVIERARRILAAAEAEPS